MLGFYSLCSYVLDKCSSRSVHLAVCPVQFALYLQLRAAADKCLWLYQGSARRYMRKCDEHISVCKSRRIDADCSFGIHMIYPGYPFLNDRLSFRNL